MVKTGDITTPAVVVMKPPFRSVGGGVVGDVCNLFI